MLEHRACNYFYSAIVMLSMKPISGIPHGGLKLRHGTIDSILSLVWPDRCGIHIQPVIGGCFMSIAGSSCRYCGSNITSQPSSPQPNCGMRINRCFIERRIWLGANDVLRSIVRVELSTEYGIDVGFGILVGAGGPSVRVGMTSVTTGGNVGCGVRVGMTSGVDVGCVVSTIPLSLREAHPNSAKINAITQNLLRMIMSASLQKGEHKARPYLHSCHLPLYCCTCTNCNSPLIFCTWKM